MENPWKGMTPVQTRSCSLFMFRSRQKGTKKLTVGRIKNHALPIPGVPCQQLQTSHTEALGGAVTRRTSGSPCTWDLGGVALLYAKCSKTVVSREKHSSTWEQTGRGHTCSLNNL